MCFNRRSQCGRLGYDRLKIDTFAPSFNPHSVNHTQHSTDLTNLEISVFSESHSSPFQSSMTLFSGIYTMLDVESHVNIFNQSECITSSIYILFVN